MAQIAARQRTADLSVRARVVRALRAVHRWVGDQSGVIYGTAAVTGAAITAVALHSDAAGVVGVVLQGTLSGLLGVLAHAVPVVLATVGALLLADRAVISHPRVGVGWALLVLVALGATHLLRGAPTPADGLHALWDGAGIAGVAAGEPLRVGLGAAAPIALVGATVAAVALLTGRNPVTFAAAQTTELLQRARRRVDKSGTSSPKPDATRRGKTSEAPKKASPATRKPERKKESKPAKASAQKTPAPVASADGTMLPSVEVLPSGSFDPEKGSPDDEVYANLLDQLFEAHKVDAAVTHWQRGPTVTRFEVALGPSGKVKDVRALADDIAYQMEAPSRLIAPLPGKQAIGVERPHDNRATVMLRDVVESAADDPRPLLAALGADGDGAPVLVDLQRLPHLLVGGATGTGKSACVTSLLTSLLLRMPPERLRLLLIDPKMVEFSVFSSAPHLLTPVITDPKKALSGLNWVVEEMDRRYELLSMLGVRDIAAFQAARDAGELPDPLQVTADEQQLSRWTEVDEEGARSWKDLPFIVVAVDELADLMLTSSREVEAAIVRIAQKSRATGIHMVIATQRPSVDVVTGLIKANLPARVALAVASGHDSKTILDQHGAEQLLGRGDMLLLDDGAPMPRRVQGCWVEQDDAGKVVAHWVEHGTQIEQVVISSAASTASPSGGVGAGGPVGGDELLWQAARVVTESQMGSVSMLQRKLNIGFSRAGRIMDELEHLGVVAPADQQGKSREVRLTPEDLEELRAQR